MCTCVGPLLDLHLKNYIYKDILYIYNYNYIYIYWHKRYIWVEIFGQGSNLSCDRQSRYLAQIQGRDLYVLSSKNLRTSSNLFIPGGINSANSFYYRGNTGRVIWGWNFVKICYPLRWESAWLKCLAVLRLHVHQLFVANKLRPSFIPTTVSKTNWARIWYWDSKRRLSGPISPLCPQQKQEYGPQSRLRLLHQIKPVFMFDLCSLCANRHLTETIQSPARGENRTLLLRKKIVTYNNNNQF